MKLPPSFRLFSHRADLAAVFFLFLLPFFFFWRQTLGWLVLADGDALFWFYPAYQFVAEQLRQGQLPLWNPYLYGGTPLFAQWQAGVLDPLNWIFLCGLSERTLTLAQQLAFSLALLGMYGYVRQLACNRRAAMFAAIVYALSGFAVARTIYPGFLHIFALAPWIFLFLERLAQQRRWRDVVFGAFFVAWQLFAAHPQPFLYTATMVAAYALWHMQWRAGGVKAFIANNWQWVLQVFSLYLGGVALAAIQLFPVAEIASQSVRQEWPYDLFTFNSLHPISLLGIVFPYLHGQGRGIYHLPYWGVYWHQIEAAIYLGGAVLSLFIVSCIAAWRWKWNLARFWSVIAIVGVLLALGRYVAPLARVLHHVPVWGQLRSPNRHWLEVIFAVAVLCALLMDRLSADGPDDKEEALRQWVVRWHIGIASLLTAIVLVVGWFGLWRPGLTQAWLRTLPDLKDMPPNFLRAASAEFWVPMLLVPIVVATAMYFLRAPQSFPRYVLLLVVVLLDFQLYAHFAPISAVEKDLTSKLGRGVPSAFKQPTQAFRSHQLLPINTSGFNPFWTYGYEFITGYDPLLNTRYKTFTRIDEAGRNYSKTLLQPEDTTLDLLNVRYVMLPPEFLNAESDADKAALHDVARWRAVPNDSPTFWYKDHQVYENLRAQPRVWLVGEVQVVRDWYQQLQRLRGEIKDEQGRAFDPRHRAIVDWLEPKSSDWIDWQSLGLQAGSSAAFTPESAKILSRGPGRLEIETDATRPSLLVISEMAYPGWQAIVDGQPTNWQRANYMLCGVALAAGKHRVEFIYHPVSIKQGAVVSFTTALILLTVIVWDWRKRH